MGGRRGSPCRELGVLRFRAGGTDGGQKGLADIMQNLASKQFSVNAVSADSEIALAKSSMAHYRLVFSGGVLNTALSDVKGLPDGLH